MHHIELRDPSQIDDEVRGWLAEAYEHATRLRCFLLVGEMLSPLDGIPIVRIADADVHIYAPPNSRIAPHSSSDRAHPKPISTLPRVATTSSGST